MNEGTSNPLHAIRRNNPFARPSGSIDSSSLSLTAGLEGAFPQFTTTNTTGFLNVASKAVLVRSIKSLLHVSVTTQAKHSAAAATFTLEMDLTPDTGSAKTFSRMGPIYLAAADTWTHIGGVHTLDLLLNSIVPGRYTLDIWVRNFTAGTLTIGDTTAATRYWSAFSYGRGNWSG